MMPGNQASSVPVVAALLSPDNKVVTPLFDYEQGGVAIGDASQGLAFQEWTGWVDGLAIRLKPANGPAVTLFEAANVNEMSFCFDQNMRPAVAFLQGQSLGLRWFDSTINGYRVDQFGEGRCPRMALDDKRASQVKNSDMIFAYITLDGRLVYRQQRDRFQTPYTLRTDLRYTDRLKNIGMGRNWRMEFEIV